MLQCWTAGWDGIAFEKEQLGQLLQLERFKRRRVEWLVEDFRVCFPHIKRVDYAGTKGELANLWAARKPFDLPKFGKPLDAATRALAIEKEKGIRFGIFSLWPEADDYRAHIAISRIYPVVADDDGLQERLLHATLGLIAAGMLPATAATPPTPPEED